MKKNLTFLFADAIIAMIQTWRGVFVVSPETIFTNRTVVLFCRR